VATVVLNAVRMILEGAAPTNAVSLMMVALALLLVVGRQCDHVFDLVGADELTVSISIGDRDLFASIDVDRSPTTARYFFLPSLSDRTQSA
jgi:hypothetical protein